MKRLFLSFCVVALLVVGCGAQPAPVQKNGAFDESDMQQFTGFLWQTTDGSHTQIGFEHSGDTLRVNITLNLGQNDERLVSTVLQADEFVTLAEQTGLGRVISITVLTQEMNFFLRQKDDYDTLEFQSAGAQINLLKTEDAK